MGLTRFLTAALVGAAAVYFWDPENGRRRRALLRDQWSKLQNRAPDYLTRQREQVQGRLTGLRHDITGAIPMPMRQEEPLDDATLKAKVESELFRDPTIDKGGININAVDGVVYLRGQAAHAGQIQEIVRKVRSIRGVRNVENELRPMGELEPTPGPQTLGPDTVH